MNTMSYKNYRAVVSYDEDAELFHGEIVDLRDVITFQGKSVKELKKAMADSIEDYLAFCKERGEEPEKPFSGQFIVRIDPPLHRAVVSAAKQAGVSLNKWGRGNFGARDVTVTDPLPEGEGGSEGAG